MNNSFKNIFLLLLASISLGACDRTYISNSYNNDSSLAISRSNPVYLRWDRKNHDKFHFLLTRNSAEDTIMVKVRWSNKSRSIRLFDDINTRLKFLVDRDIVYSFKPFNKPKVVGYNLNDDNSIEEASFMISDEIFRKIAYAKNVTVELRGANKISSAFFHPILTKKRFVEFYERAY